MQTDLDAISAKLAVGMCVHVCVRAVVHFDCVCPVSQTCRALYFTQFLSLSEPPSTYMYDVHIAVHGFESHPRQLIFLRKSDCLGCAVLLCLVCLFDLACFFLSSFSSLIKTCTHIQQSV